MNRVLQFGFILACLTGISLGGRATCSYFGEPHLIPYPTECEPIQYQYICQPKAPEVLVSNPYVVINVESTPIGNYPILKYNLTILGVPGYPSSCFIGDSITAPKPFPPTCPSDSPVIVVVSGTNYYLIHKTQPEIIIYINKVKRYFEISIDLPFGLIEKSEGTCIEWDCEFETELIPGTGKRSAGSDGLFEELCDFYINNGVSDCRTYGSPDPGVVRGRKEACLYDLRMGADILYAYGAYYGIVQDCIKPALGGPKGESTYGQAFRGVTQSICRSSEKEKEIINKYPQYCLNSQCITPEPRGSECSASSNGGRRDEN